MFGIIKDFLRKNKRNILFLVGFVFIYFILSDGVFADGYLKNGEEWTETGKKVKSVFDWLSTIITVLVSLLTYLSTVFLSPEWINGSLFGLNAYFKQIWIMMSNVVYFIFAFILIWIAFMNIIGKGGDKYQLKQALPKFIVGILIVPFSWFLVQFILSISAILTISAINLPFDTFSGFNTKLSGVEIPKHCEINLTSGRKAGEADGKTDLSSYFNCKPDSKENKIFLSDLMNSSSSTNSIFGVMGVYTYGILGLENISNLNGEDLEQIRTIFDLAVKVIFDLLFVVVYAILMIALGMVLMTRGIYIWIYVMISPIFGLMYFFDKTEGGGEFFDKFNVKQFISLALVPVYTMLALSFGMLFMFIVGQGMTDADPVTDGIPGVKISDTEVPDGSTLIIGANNEDDKNLSLTIIGSPANPKNITNFISKVGNDSLGVFGTLILKIFGIVVLWGAVMAALRTNEVTKAIVEPLHAFGTQVGGIVKSLPHHTPIPGVGSMSSMKQIAGKYQQTISNKSVERATRMSKRLPFLGDTEAYGELQKIRTELSSGSVINATQQAEILRKILKTTKGDINPLKTTAYLDTLKDLGKNLELDTSTFKNNSGKEIIETILKPIEAKLEEKGGGAASGIFKGPNIPESYNEVDLKKFLTDLYAGTARPGDNATNNVKIEITNNGSKISGVNREIELTRDGDGLYSLGYDRDLDDLAKYISQGKVGQDIYNDFSEVLKGKLKAYFNQKGEYVEKGGQDNGKFPWENK